MSILRSSKYLKHFTSFNRSFVINKPREIDALLIKKSPLLVTSTRFLRHVAAQASTIEKHFQKLDQGVRRTGRVNKKELDNAFSEMKGSKQASGSQSLMIIRCCGNLLPEETPEVRIELVKKIWNSLEKMGVPLDISHYNTLLRVHLENEYDFSPTEILAEIQNKDIEPNRVTFQLLINAYCQKGDIEGATKILEFMKEKQMPVNESVFSSLIKGHFQSGDPQSALGILSVMKQANITATNDTYTVVMCGHAKTGDINAINETLAQCEGAEVDIADRDILEVMFSLAVNNHISLIEQLFEKLKHSPGYNQDAKNVILRLIVQGQDEAAMKILRSMTNITSSDGSPLPVGNFLIKHMVKCKRPLEKVIAVCEELKQSGENEYALSIATEASLVHGSPKTSLKLLSALAKEREVCQHYYWPVLVQYGKARNIEGIKTTLVKMVEAVGQPLNGETLRDFVSPYVSEGEPGVHEMRNAGVPVASAAASMVGHLLAKNRLESAVKTGLRFRAKYSSVYLCHLAVTALINTEDIKSFVTLVRVIVENDKEELEKEHSSPADRLILEAVNALRYEGKTKMIHSLLQAFHESGIPISSDAAEKLETILHGNELTPEISSLLSKLTSPDLVLCDLERPERSESLRRGSGFNIMNNEGVLLSTIESAESRGEAALGLKRQLLSFYCVNKELEKAEKLLKDLETSGFEFATGTLVHCLDLYVHHNKLPEALEIYNRIFKEPTTIDPSKIVRLGGLMITQDKLEDALQLFEKHSIDAIPSERRSIANSVGWRLLNSLAETKDPELLKKVFHKLVETKLLEPTNVTLGPLIKVHILRDDIESALAEFEDCCQKYRATPWKNEIACKLIQKEDPVSLQKLTDLSTDIHGEINSLYDLVLSFIECGRIRQARKILETPGLRLRNQRINSACERYNSEGKVNYLENLVEATKDLNHIDRCDIYYHLLLSYSKTGDVDKAFGLWTQMQDEDVPPSDVFLVKLGSLLQENGRPVPFSVPNIDVPEHEENKSTLQATSQVKEFRKIMNSNNVDEACDALSSIRQQDLSVGDRSKLINLLVNNGRIGEASKMLIDWYKKGLKPNLRTINTVLNSLAKIGDVDTIVQIGNLLDKELLRLTSFANRYAHSMATAGRTNEFLSKLEEDIKAAKTQAELDDLRESFPRGGIFSVIEGFPDSISKFEEIATLYKDRGITDPINVLWAHYFSKGNIEKSQELWTVVGNRERIMIQPILKQIRSNKDIALAWDLLNLFKLKENTAQLIAPIYSTLIDVEISAGNLLECERILEEALKEFTTENINRATLMRLKRNLEASGKSFKYTLPQRKNRRLVEDSSSSSDSDSDSEKVQKSRV